MMVLGFLMVWTYDMVSRATSENDQLGQVWDRVVMRFLDHDLPSFGQKRKVSDTAQTVVAQKAATQKAATQRAATQRAATQRATANKEDESRFAVKSGSKESSGATRADMPALSPEEYARQTRLRRASSTRAEQEMRAHAAPREKKPAAERRPARLSETGTPETHSPRATAVKQRVERTRRALDDIISRVTKVGE
jgi:hypothetical protein